MSHSPSSCDFYTVNIFYSQLLYFWSFPDDKGSQTNILKIIIIIKKKQKHATLRKEVNTQPLQSHRWKAINLPKPHSERVTRQLSTSNLLSCNKSHPELVHFIQCWEMPTGTCKVTDRSSAVSINLLTKEATSKSTTRYILHSKRANRLFSTGVNSLNAYMIHKPSGHTLPWGSKNRTKWLQSGTQQL